MNAQETLAIIEALRVSGATHFKSSDFEITLKAGAPLEQLISPVSAPGMVEAQSPPGAPIQENEESTQKLKDLINTMKMTPEQLADQLFPHGAL